jgi:ABC-type amino acid transport substrate-binding protein
MKKLIIAAAAVAAVTTATSASAQATSSTPRATANARLIKPLTLASLRDVNFGTIVMGTVTTDQTVTIDRVTGLVSCGSNTVLACSGTPTTGQYRVTGTQGQVVVISSAASFPLSNGLGGTLNFVPSFQPNLTLANSGSTGNDFFVGGSITIGSGTQDGVYTGQIDIQVSYQ